MGIREEVVKACGCPRDRANDVRFEMRGDHSEITQREFVKEAKAAWARIQELERA